MNLRQPTSPHPYVPMLLALCFSVALPIPMHAAKPKPAPDHWVATWATGVLAAPALPAAGGFVPGASDTTLRQIVHVSLGTSAAAPLVRIEFTNALGAEPLTLGAVHIALSAPDPTGPTSDISLFTANAVTFNGASSITIPAGGEAVSDPAALTLPPDSDLAISIFLPAQKISVVTRHDLALQSNFFVPGNAIGQRSLTTPQVTQTWFFLKSVDVQTPAATAAIVAFGDSITDGYGSTPDANRRWPSLLAARLQSGKKTANLAVVDEGISANRVLHDGYGPSALARFDREVLTLPGVRYVILLEGINDIGNGTKLDHPYDPLTADDLIAALSQLAERAHTHNIKVFGATLTPYMGAGYSSPAGEAIRQSVNAWIRTTKVFDGVIDFDKITQNPTAPTTFNPAYDVGDHLHPSDAGYQAMADSIDLKLFESTD